MSVQERIEYELEKARAEGEAIGIAKGEAIGIAKGEAIGIAKGERQVIVRGLRNMVENYGMAKEEALMMMGVPKTEWQGILAAL